jgi:transcription initiation factor TFIIE subunit alpha
MASKKSSKKSLASSLKKIISRKKPVKKTAKAVKKTPKKTVKKAPAKKPVKKKAVKKVAKKPVKKKAAVKKPKIKKAVKKKALKPKNKKAVKVKAKPHAPKHTFRKLKSNKDHYQFLLDCVSDEGMDVVKRIVEKEVSDVELTETLTHLKPNIVRKHLYALYEAGVVTYRRHRSKTGWYTYYWKLHPDRIDVAIVEGNKQYLRELQDVLTYERENDFYECKGNCTRVIFDEAMDMKFRCPRCEKQLEFTDNNKRIAQLQRQMDKLSKL